MYSNVFIIYELSSARVDVHRSKTSLLLNSLKINSPSLLLFARMFTARVTKKIPLMNLFAIRIFVQFFFIRMFSFMNRLPIRGYRFSNR